MKTRIVLLGPPASGKGTQAHLITERCGIQAASTGAILRDELERGTPIGVQADKFTRDGGLAPDSMVIELVRSWLSSHRNSFVFDGFPRTIAQAEALDQILVECETALDVVFFFNASEATIRERILRRVNCAKCGRIYGAGIHFEDDRPHCPACGGALIRRKDDTLEAIEHRFAAYREKTAPLVEFYKERGLLHELAAESSPDEVFNQILSVLEGL